VSVKRGEESEVDAQKKPLTTHGSCARDSNVDDMTGRAVAKWWFSIIKLLKDA
jgi:hypothetical protein